MHKFLSVFSRWFVVMFFLSITGFAFLVSSTSWDSNIDSSMVAYYDMQNSSVVDLTGNGNNGTANGNAGFSADGIIGKGYTGDGSNSNVQINSVTTTGTTFSISFWFNTTATSGFFFDNYDGSQRNLVLISAANTIRFSTGGTNYEISETFNDGSWHHYAVTSDGANKKIYFDGVSVSNVSSGSTYTIDTTSAIGSNRVGATNDVLNGMIDEFMISDEVWTHSEVVNLYGGGSPPEYNDTGSSDNSPVVSLNFPSADDYLLTQSVSFNCSASDDIKLENVSLYINGVLNETNSSGVNNSNYIFTKNLSYGFYNWTCSATDNNSQNTVGSTRDFQVREDNSYLNLIAWFKMDNSSAIDSSGNGNHGTSLGNNTFPSGGISGNALYVDGVSGGIDIDSVTTSDGVWTWSYWIKTTNNDLDNDHYFVLDSYNGASPHRLANVQSAHAIHSDINGPDYNFTDNISDLNDNKWHHLVNVLNDTKLHLYIDGISVKNFTSVAVSDMGGNSMIGAGWSGATHDPWLGYIDEVKIYDIAWNVTEVLSEFSSKSNDITNPTVLFYNQSPSDITSTNAFGDEINITYNITDETALNISSIKIFYKTNGTTDDVTYYENGTAYDGFFSKSYDSNNSELFLFELDDNEILPGTYNLNEGDLEIIPKSNYDLGSGSNYIKTRFFNVTNNTQYSFFEFQGINKTVNSNPLKIYYCNSSYISGKPTTSDDCALFYELTADTEYNHTHGAYSFHYLVPFGINTTTGTINDIKVTSTSYFLFRGVNPQTNSWNISYITNISRTDTTQTSSNSGVSWNNFPGTLDAHLHQFESTEYLRYYVVANDTSGNENISVLRSDLLDVSSLPPNSPNVYSPTNTTYSPNNININWTQSISPSGFDIVDYNISLMHSNYTFIETINGSTTDLSLIFDASGLDGGYIVRVTVTDNNSFSSFSDSEIFSVDGTSPVINTNIETGKVYYKSTGSPVTMDLSYSIVDSNFDSSNYTLSYANGTTILSNSSALASGNFQFNGTELKHFVWLLWANDTAGNSVEKTITFKLDLDPDKLGGATVEIIEEIIEEFHPEEQEETNLTLYIIAGSLFAILFLMGFFTKKKK